ncbi:MAG: glycosyltransferase family 2 protein [Synechococcus sp.]
MSPPLILSERRRVKASLVLVCVWLAVVTLHLVPETRWVILGLAAGMVVYAGRLTTADPFPAPPLLDRQNSISSSAGATDAASHAAERAHQGSPDGLSPSLIPDSVAARTHEASTLPLVSLMIPAKNEALVIPGLLASLQALDYPSELFEVWIVDDASTDETFAVVKQWQKDFPQLRIYQRSQGAGGGKSGALNEVFPLTFGEIIGVLDADATIPPDFLRRSLAIFQEKPEVAALQVRKAIANGSNNFWTGNQVAEMALDSYFQQQRRAIGGVGELRGNGQLLRRVALEKVKGWNEATITDDLDLTFRLHLLQQDVAYLASPAVQEEGVLRWSNLWPQRTRWAEGGYQRYLDYWPGILRNRLGNAKTLDLAIFFLIQYLLPMAAVPDFVMASLYSHEFVLWPLSLVIVLFSAISMARGLYTHHQITGVALLSKTLMGTVYMFHWIPVMILTTAKMCVRAKQMRWVKTLHVGGHSSST